MASRTCSWRVSGIGALPALGVERLPCPLDPLRLVGQGDAGMGVAPPAAGLAVLPADEPAGMHLRLPPSVGEPDADELDPDVAPDPIGAGDDESLGLVQ